MLYFGKNHCPFSCSAEGPSSCVGIGVMTAWSMVHGGTLLKAVNNSNKHKQGSISKNFMMQTKNMDVICFHQSFNSISLTYKYTMCVIWRQYSPHISVIYNQDKMAALKLQYSSSTVYSDGRKGDILSMESFVLYWFYFKMHFNYFLHIHYKW